MQILARHECQYWDSACYNDFVRSIELDMRTKLKEIDKQRRCFTATVKRYGGKLTNIPRMNVYSWQETLLVVNVKDAITKEVLTDHLWFKVGKRIQSLNAQTGDIVQFCARVDNYFKKVGEDYHLENPTQLKIVESDHSLFPEETARTVGSGIAYAKQLRKQYQSQSRECYA